MSARPLPEGFTPYTWATPSEAVAARHGLRATDVIRFDANVPPLPGVPRVPIGESFAGLNSYPEGSYRDLREAAAGYCGVGADQIVVGAGADELIGVVAHTFLGPGLRAAISPPTYALYRIASQLQGAEVVTERDGADLVWVCNPENPTGALTEPHELVELARSLPAAVVVVDEAYWEYGGKTVVPLLREAPNVIVLRTLSKAFGLAALRVGYSVSSAELAAELAARRAPAPVTAPSARIAAAALRSPRLDVEECNVERARVRDALLAAGYRCPVSAGNFLYIEVEDAAGVADRLEERGLVVRRFPAAIRATVRLPAENDLLLEALGVPAPPTTTRSALVIRNTAETSLRISLRIDGQGRSRIDTGIAFLDHMLAQLVFHGGLDLELLAGGDLDVDEHHTVEDVLAALGDALTLALGSREGITRYGSAIVPMDEARASAAIDLVRRPHAEVDLRFEGERVGGLALTLLPHALERFTMQAGITLHVESAGTDDHHVVEAAFKALGRALREACAANVRAVASTKGSL